MNLFHLFISVSRNKKARVFYFPGLVFFLLLLELIHYVNLLEIHQSPVLRRCRQKYNNQVMMFPVNQSCLHYWSFTETDYKQIMVACQYIEVVYNTKKPEEKYGQDRRSSRNNQKIK